MTEVVTKVYTFDELSDRAKERAREWYREGALDYEWWEFVCEDSKEIGFEIEEFDLYRRTITGKLVGDAVYTAKAILENHGEECGTYSVAKRLLADAVGLHMIHGKDYEYHESFEELIEGFRTALEREYLSMLDKEHEWLMSDECVDETIQANEYTFTEEGRRFG